MHCVVIKNGTAQTQFTATVALPAQAAAGDTITLNASGNNPRSITLTAAHITAGQVVVNSDLLTVLPRHFVPTTGMSDQLVLRELPLDVTPVHVEALWHRRVQHDSAHQWLRGQLLQIAQAAFTKETLA